MHTGTASTGGRWHAPAHHRPQWLRQEFSIPDPWWALAHLWRRALQAPAPAHVLHPPEVSGAGRGREPGPRLCPFPLPTCGTDTTEMVELGASGEDSKMLSPESEGLWSLRLPPTMPPHLVT